MVRSRKVGTVARRDGRGRQRLVQAIPVLCPLSMWAGFAALGKRLPPRQAYNLGFATYWALWCFAVPAWLLGPRRALAVIRAGRRPTVSEAALLAVPVLGAVGTALAPNARRVDAQLAAVMLGTATVNAIGEELLWRGLFAEEFPDDVLRGSAWPLVGFSLWHLAPQTILPSRHGRWQLVAGAAFVGLSSTVVAHRTGGLWHTLAPHIATDACGVAAAEFRLGR
ncbi:MAG TPA: CPBP family intramembrane glutamic endopeptidase [Actinotalea sp.]